MREAREFRCRYSDYQETHLLRCNFLPRHFIPRRLDRDENVSKNTTNLLKEISFIILLVRDSDLGMMVCLCVWVGGGWGGGVGDICNELTEFGLCGLFVVFVFVLYSDIQWLICLSCWGVVKHSFIHSLFFIVVFLVSVCARVCVCGCVSACLFCVWEGGGGGGWWVFLLFCLVFACFVVFFVFLKYFYYYYLLFILRMGLL